MYELARRWAAGPGRKTIRALRNVVRTQSGRARRAWTPQAERIDRHERLLECLFRDVPEGERSNLQVFDRMYTLHGALKSTAALGAQSKLDLDLHFQHREKAEVALTVASSWYGGDFMEFGSHDLTTFRNILTAFDVCRLDARCPDTRFYAFDIFGSLDSASEQALSQVDSIQPRERAPGERGYFDQFMARGDQYEQHLQYVKDHRLFEDRCILVQGLFQDTLTEERRVAYRDSGRRIGFACIDVNRAQSYKIVFDFIYGLMGENSYIYMDEFFQEPEVLNQVDQLREQLREERRIGCTYVRNAAGFGGLLRLYPLAPPKHPLDLRL